MSNTRDLDRFVKLLDLAVSDAPKKYKAMQRKVSDKFFESLLANAPPDDEGRLSASFRKQPWEGQEEWVEELKRNEVEVGTKVYYASMVNDGHVIGKRARGNNHRKRSAQDRMTGGGYSIRKGWVEGQFFLEKAEGATEEMLGQIGEEFMAELLKGVAD